MTPLNTQTNIADRAVCLFLNFSLLGVSKKVAQAAVTTEADPEMIKVSQLILDSDELAAIRSKDGELRRWIYAQALPSPFTSGCYLLPNRLIAKVSAKLQEFVIERDALVQTFITAYPRLVKAARPRLTGVYNPANYPAVSALPAYFGFSWDYWTFSTPASLQDISAEFFDQEKEKAQSRWNQAGIEVQIALRESMSKLVSHMVDKLSGLNDGTSKRFHASTLSNVTEFLDVFEDRNIANDKDLSALVAKARKLVAGVDPASLKTEEGLRDSILNGFQQIQTKLDAMVEDKPSRKITLADEPLADAEAA